MVQHVRLLRVPGAAGVRAGQLCGQSRCQVRMAGQNRRCGSVPGAAGVCAGQLMRPGQMPGQDDRTE